MGDQEVVVLLVAESEVVLPRLIEHQSHTAPAILFIVRQLLVELPSYAVVLVGFVYCVAVCGPPVRQLEVVHGSLSIATSLAGLG